VCFWVCGDSHCFRLPSSRFPRPIRAQTHSAEASEALPAVQHSYPVLHHCRLDRICPFSTKRCYLLGNNSYACPWSFPLIPTSSIEEDVRAEFPDFADRVNTLMYWPWWHHAVLKVLLVLHHWWELVAAVPAEKAIRVFADLRAET